MYTTEMWGHFSVTFLVYAFGFTPRKQRGEISSKMKSGMTEEKLKIEITGRKKMDNSACMGGRAQNPLMAR